MTMHQMHYHGHTNPKGCKSELDSDISKNQDNEAVFNCLISFSHNDMRCLYILTSLINRMPNAPFTMSEILRKMPCPAIETILMLLTERYQLSLDRAVAPNMIFGIEINICVVLCCLAEKIVGVQSTIIFTENVRDYLLYFVMYPDVEELVLFSLIALEKFAITSSNKILINNVLEQEGNPLLPLEEHSNSGNHIWRQIGFCARWALDNTFPVTNRRFSYELVNMNHINVLLNQNSNIFLKRSPDGLEIRCDTNDLKTLRATHAVERGVWYFEVTLVTAGPMQFGWATSEADMDDDYDVGIDEFSVGYDGSRSTLWYRGNRVLMNNMNIWAPGDIVGCFLDIGRKLIIFTLNGVTTMTPFTEIFHVTCPHNRQFFAVASLLPFQQCRFNFGHKEFVYSPENVEFSVLNEFGQLTAEQKMLKPRSLTQGEDMQFNTDDNACEICYDRTAAVTLHPCGHNTFCGPCASQLNNCPICRVDIANFH